VLNKPTPVKLPHFSNILGKQQQLQLQQQQQQKQQYQEQDQEEDLPTTPRSRANGHGRPVAGGAVPVASGSSGSRGNFNSALSDKMHQLKLIETNGSNGTRR